MGTGQGSPRLDRRPLRYSGKRKLRRQVKINISKEQLGEEVCHKDSAARQHPVCLDSRLRGGWRGNEGSGKNVVKLGPPLWRWQS